VILFIGSFSDLHGFLSDGILTMVNTPVNTKEKPMTLTREIVGEDLVLVSQELHFNYIKKQYNSAINVR
jgi:hypothetical protein